MSHAAAAHPGVISPDRAVGTEAGFYAATFDSLPASIAVIDPAGVIVAVNAAWTTFTEDNEGDAASGVGANYLDACAGVLDEDAGSTAREAAAGLRAILAGTRDELVLTYDCHSPREHRWFVMTAARVAYNGPARVVVQHQNVTDRREAEEAARVRARLLDTVDAAVLSLDQEGLTRSWNRGAQALFGWSSEEMIGRSLADKIAADLDQVAEMRAEVQRTGSWEGKIDSVRKDGSTFTAYVRNVRLDGPAGEFQGYATVAIDFTERLAAEHELRAARDYLRAVADSMAEGLCTLDEHGVIVFLNPRAEELLGWSTEDLLGEDMHRVLHHTHSDGTPFSDIRERKQLERQAESKLVDLEWIERINHALSHDRLVLFAQPIVEISSGAVLQHELLIRMLDEDGAIIAPGKFLPVAEKYGLIGEIDRWVVRQCVEMAANGYGGELNVSAHSVSDPTFADFVDAELLRTGADPALLIFELTETALLRDQEAALHFARSLAARGCQLALDDFGTGFGGYSYLKQLPVSYLKIDIEFVRDAVCDPASRKLVEAVVNLARDFGIKTVAEGVEDADTLAVLEQCGVDYAQGYWIGRPTALEQTTYRRTDDNGQ
jgi:PAS domain S-box-containing protein